MNEKDINEVRWGAVMETPPLPKNLMEESLSILENTFAFEKEDVVNWEERAKLNESSKRNGHLILKEDEEYYDKKSNNEDSQIQTDKPLTKEERDLISYGADLVDFMEGK
jgi:hypothetical protein